MKSQAHPFSAKQARPAFLIASTLLLWPLGAGAGPARQQTPAPAAAPHPGLPSLGGSESDPLARVDRNKLEHMREDERRTRLLSDTAKLVALSTELKAEVEKTSKDELSLDVVRKAAELEKLAHDVKERMKG